MTNNEKRMLYEMYKMTKKFKEFFVFSHALELKDCYTNIKKTYFEELLQIDKPEEIELDITEELANMLYNMADEQDITVDEVVMNILKEYLEKSETPNDTNQEEYYYLKEGDTIQEGDEYFYGYNNWFKTLYAGSVICNDDCYRYRRKINTKNL